MIPEYEIRTESLRWLSDEKDRRLVRSLIKSAYISGVMQARLEVIQRDLEKIRNEMGRNYK